MALPGPRQQLDVEKLLERLWATDHRGSLKDICRDVARDIRLVCVCVPGGVCLLVTGEGWSRYSSTRFAVCWCLASREHVYKHFLEKVFGYHPDRGDSGRGWLGIDDKRKDLRVELLSSARQYGYNLYHVIRSVSDSKVIEVDQLILPARTQGLYSEGGREGYESVSTLNGRLYDQLLQRKSRFNANHNQIMVKMGEHYHFIFAHYALSMEETYSMFHDLSR
jgi:hypothetical protein